MGRRKRPELAAEARRRNLEQLARLGGELRHSRVRRRLTQKRLGDRVGLSQSAISEIERGHGGGYSLDTWQRLFIGLDRPLVVEGRRDPLEELRDGGHLAIQELILGQAKRAGFHGTFELPVASGTSRHSIDVFLRSDERRLLIVCEAWNSFGDIGASSRSFAWKMARAEDVAAGLDGEAGFRIRGCWVIRATASNRTLLHRYPTIFSTRFPGSSLRWTQALTIGTEPPEQPGLLWCDRAAVRLFPFRYR